jgi:hypothetical protein
VEKLLVKSGLLIQDGALNKSGSNSRENLQKQTENYTDFLRTDASKQSLRVSKEAITTAGIWMTNNS